MEAKFILPDIRVLSDGQPATNLPAPLYKFLTKTNGVYAYADALHVFHSDPSGTPGSLEWWNNKNTWIHEYKEYLGSYLFFAEDIFGYQFALHHNKVFLFDPVDCIFEPFAPTFEAWLQKIQSDPNEVGYGFAKDWQKNQALSEDDRIMVYPPFNFSDNDQERSYKAAPRVELLYFYAKIHKNLPNDGQVEVEMTE